jgi:uncharacterized membrane protein YdcZ (DUF606 family)
MLGLFFLFSGIFLIECLGTTLFFRLLIATFIILVSYFLG